MTPPTEKTRTPWNPETLVLAILAAAVPVTFASGFTHFAVLKEAVFGGGGGLLLILFAVRALRGRPTGIAAVVASLPLAALALTALLSSLWAPNTAAALAGSAHWVAMLGVTLTLLNPGVRAKLEPIIAALGAGVGVAAALGIAHAFGVDIHGLSPGRIADGFRGTFDNERLAAFAMAGAVPLLALGAAGWKGATRIVAGIGAAIGAVYLGVAEIPDAWIAAGAGTAAGIALTIVASKGRGMNTVKLAAAGAGVAMALVAVGSQVSPAKPAEVAGATFESLERNMATRDHDWSRPTSPASPEASAFARVAGTRMLSSAKVFGVGQSGFDAMAPGVADFSAPYYKSQSSGYPFMRSAHNSYLQVAAELGLVGLGLLVLAVALALLLAWRSLGRKSDDDSEVPHAQWAALLASLFAMLAGFYFEDGLSQPFIGLLFASVLAGMLAMSTDDSVLGRAWKVGFAGGSGNAVERYIAAALLPLAAGGFAILMVAVPAISDYQKAAGDVWLRAGRLDDARKSYEAAINTYEGNALAMFNLAGLEELNKSYTRSEQLLLEAARLRPTDPRLPASLGAVQLFLAMESGRKKVTQKFKPRAKEAGGPPQKVNPAELVGHMDIAITGRAIGNGRRALELHPRFHRAYLDLSNIYMTQRKVEESQKVLKRALKEFEADPDLACDLNGRIGRGYLVDENWVEADKYLEAALELSRGGSQRDALIRDLERVEALIKGKGRAPAHKH